MVDQLQTSWEEESEFVLLHCGLFAAIQSTPFFGDEASIKIGYHSSQLQVQKTTYNTQSAHVG